MHVPVNYVSVIMAAIASMALGFVWYGVLFRRQWMTLSGMPVERIGAVKKSNAGKNYAMAFLGSIVMAYVLANVFTFASAYFKSGDIVTGLMVGVWTWLGFAAPITLGAVLWEGKPWKLWILNNAYYLLTLTAMGAVIALWQ